MSETGSQGYSVIHRGQNQAYYDHDDHLMLTVTPLSYDHHDRHDNDDDDDSWCGKIFSIPRYMLPQN